MQLYCDQNCSTVCMNTCQCALLTVYWNLYSAVLCLLRELTHEWICIRPKTFGLFCACLIIKSDYQWQPCYQRQIFLFWPNLTRYFFHLCCFFFLLQSVKYVLQYNLYFRAGVPNLFNSMTHVGPSKTRLGSGCVVSPQRGPGQNPGCHWFLVYFNCKFDHFKGSWRHDYAACKLYNLSRKYSIFLWNI
jgi:hypothetical protein